MGWEHVRVVGEGHFDDDAVGHQLQIIVGEFSPVLRRDGVAPEEIAGGGAAQSTGAGVKPDGEVRGAFDDEVEGDACGRLTEEERQRFISTDSSDVNIVGP